MRWYSVKPDGWSVPVWRAARTFVQTGAPSLAAWLSQAAVAQSFDWAALGWYVAIPSLSAALSAWSNR